MIVSTSFPRAGPRRMSPAYLSPEIVPTASIGRRSRRREWAAPQPSTPSVIWRASTINFDCRKMDTLENELGELKAFITDLKADRAAQKEKFALQPRGEEFALENQFLGQV